MGASSNTFKILGSIYAEDGNNIYRFDYDPYNGNSAKILEDADRDSFTVINDFFAKDKKKVYFSGYSGYSDFADSALSASDPRYFEVLSNRYAKDNSSVYVVICYEGCVIDKIDANPNTFRVINDIYTADKDRVYCYGKNGDGIPKIVVVEGVNLSTFISDPSIKWNIDYGKGPDAYDKYNQYKKCKKYVPGY